MSKTYLVTLMLTVPEDDDHPDEWNWSALMDLGYYDVILEDVREVE